MGRLVAAAAGVLADRADAAARAASASSETAASLEGTQVQAQAASEARLAASEHAQALHSPIPQGEGRASGPIPGFALMPDGQDDGRLGVASIEDEVPAVAEVDGPLSELWSHALGRPADAGLMNHDLHTVADGLDGPLGSLGILAGQEPMEALHVEQGLGGPDHAHTAHTWHAGGSTSCPASSWTSQASASA